MPRRKWEASNVDAPVSVVMIGDLNKEFYIFKGFAVDKYDQQRPDFFLYFSGAPHSVHTTPTKFDAAKINWWGGGLV